MKQTLRFAFVALMAMVYGNTNAQEVTLDFTLTEEADSKASVWGFPASSKNKTVDEQSFTYGGYTVKVAGSTGEGYYWHDKDHYLLFGKQGAMLTLPAFSFDVERIDVEGNGGASANTKQNIYVGETPVSTETTGAQGTNLYAIADAYQAAGTIYVIKVNSNHNDQIKTIKIWKKGTAETPVTPEVQEINVAKALEAIAALADGATTSEKYQVKGYVVGAPDFQRKDDGSLYGNVNCTIADEKGGTQLLTVYRGKNFGNQSFTEETISTLKEGDEVVFEGQLQKYVDKEGVMIPEIKNCYLISINGKDAASVNAIKSDLDANAPAYNVAGQRVSADYRGVVIKNGKKLLNR